MSRVKSKQNLGQVDICADCGAPDPPWASVNRGILLCIQCCSIHRRLGSHISLVKSLKKSPWYPSQLKMVLALHNGGANKIWEHTLYENSTKTARRKPTPKDTSEVKTEFINNKHKSCAYVLRTNNEDGLLCVENELGKELHSSVRTTVLESTLRLLIQGADVNYFHDEKGSTPLHVAVKSNQILQVELLLIYGADPAHPDALGKTPLEYARQCVNKDILSRLIENQYEMTDKFTKYLCNRKPDHGNNQHFFIPQISIPLSPTATEKLRKLPNNLFEELAKDVYDEVDRREIETIWLSSADCIDLNTVPFLPVNSELSSIRNQSRQKIARFTSPELKALVYDILRDAHRRRLESLGKGSNPMQSQICEDDPLYDSVASDDDYADVTCDSPFNETDNNKIQSKNQSPTSSSNSTTNVNSQAAVPPAEVEELSLQLKNSDMAISSLKAEVTGLKALVEQLSSENFELKSRLSTSNNVSLVDSTSSAIGTTPGNFNNNNTVALPSSRIASMNGDSGSQSLDGLLFASDRSRLMNGNYTENNNTEHDFKQAKNRPSSMYETREYNRVPNWQAMKMQIKQNEQNRFTSQSLYAPQQNLNMHFKKVTHFLTEFWKCAQSDGRQNCTQFSEQIRLAIAEFVDALSYTKSGSDEIVKHLLCSVKDLHVNCIYLQDASRCGHQVNIETYMQKVREFAYEIAQDMKQLYTIYTNG